MKSTKSLPILLFAVTTALFGGLYVVLLAWAHNTTVNVSTPGISVTKSPPWLYVNTSHPWSFSSSHQVTAEVDYSHSVPNFISNNGTSYYTGYAGSGTEYLYSSYQNPPTGDHTVYATSDIEADYVTDQALNTKGFSWP